MATRRRMNFWKRSKRPLNPPPSFLENHVANLYQFHVQKALFKGPKFQTKIFGLKISPPLLELFRNFIRFGLAILPLGW